MTSNSFVAHRRPVRSSVVVLALTSLALPVVGVATADAYVHRGEGCRFDPKNDDDGLGIAFDTADPDYNATENTRTQYAASDWNNKMGPNFTIVSPYGSTKRDVGVTWAALGTTYATMTRPCGDDHYTQDPIFTWSTNASYAETQGQQVAIAVHELGHAYGLAHNQTAGCNQTVGNAGLMYSDPLIKQRSVASGGCGWANPTDDDVAGATTAHNGQW